jgi:hypothetical protein
MDKPLDLDLLILFLCFAGGAVCCSLVMAILRRKVPNIDQLVEQIARLAEEKKLAVEHYRKLVKRSPGEREQEKARIMGLARKILAGKASELSAEEIAEVKQKAPSRLRSAIHTKL